jgi:uncharacterized SAM-binding protein YcdF (DUF218 family)
MGYFLTKLIGTLLTPGTLLLLGMLAGMVLLWSRRRRGGRRLVTALTVLFLLIVISPVQPFLTRNLEDRFPANPLLPDHVDGIVILGGAIEPAISRAHRQIALNDAAERMVQGAILARWHPEARVVFTGGSADPLRPDAREAPLAAALLVELGVDPQRLTVEDQSRNTYENAIFTERLVEPKPGQQWVLVTSARHMPRSVGAFRRAGWHVIAYPVDFSSAGDTDWADVDLPVQRLRLFAQALHEWLGLVFYRLAGWSDSLFPGQPP